MPNKSITDEQKAALKVACDKCGAAIGEFCTWGNLGKIKYAFHLRRQVAASRLPPAPIAAKEELVEKLGKEMENALDVAVIERTEARLVAPIAAGTETWPIDCVQRAFVEGMKWWQFHHNGSTAFPSERDEAEVEAIKRYATATNPTPSVQQKEEKL